MRTMRIILLIVAGWLACTAIILLIVDQMAERPAEEGVLEYCAAGTCVYRLPNGERIVRG